MTRYALIYGLFSGTVIVTIIIVGLAIGPHGGIFSSALFGYLVMLSALTFIFVGMKRYRDVEKGGVIRFLPAFGLGLAIAAVAGLAYVGIWEAYLAYDGYHFMDEYVAAAMRRKREAGLDAAALASAQADLDQLRISYANPLFRLPMTFIEIFPVGFIVSLISAALLRNPRLLPARAA